MFRFCQRLKSMECADSNSAKHAAQDTILRDATLRHRLQWFSMLLVYAQSMGLANQVTQTKQKQLLALRHALQSRQVCASS
jgi:hypothetical protein